MIAGLLLLLFTTITTTTTTTAEWVKRYREFDFNSTRTNYESLRIAPVKDRFIVRDIKHADSISHSTADGKQINFNKDQYVAVAGDQVLAVNGHQLTTLTVREILRQSSGSFMLPLVGRPDDVNDKDPTQTKEQEGGYQVIKWLKLEIVEAETISYRPQLAARQAKMRRANFESKEKQQMKKDIEENHKKAARKKAMDLEEGEKSVARRSREEEESKHKRKMLQAAKEMDQKQKALESAEKARAEAGCKCRRICQGFQTCGVDVIMSNAHHIMQCTSQ